MQLPIVLWKKAPYTFLTPTVGAEADVFLLQSEALSLEEKWDLKIHFRLSFCPS